MQQIKRYEIKTCQLKRRLMGFGIYDKLKQEYPRMITFDYLVNHNKIAVCVGFAKCSIPDLMNRFEDYAKEIFKRLMGAGICNNFDDIDWHMINYGMYDDEFEINRVIFENEQIVSWSGKNTLFHF